MLDLSKFRVPIILFLIGVIFIGGAILLSKIGIGRESKVEVLGVSSSSAPTGMSTSFGNEIVVEIEGAVEKPGVYHLKKDSRIEDLLVSAGGLSQSADRKIIDKNINRAAKLSDGQKVYMPAVGEQSNVLSASTGVIQLTESSSGGTQININTASQSELESLSGIGPVYAKKIIDQRPYSDVNDLVSKKILTSSLYEKIKDNISVN